MKKLYTKFIICIFATTTVISCNGQPFPQSLKLSESNISIGTTVSKLDDTIWDIFQDSNSNYWFGSKEHGVFFFDGKQLKQITKKDGLVSNEIRGIQEDSTGNIYIETTSGVSKFDGHSFQTLEIMDDDSSKDKWFLNKDDLWFRIGFDKQGPFRYDGEYLHYLKFPKSPQEDAFLEQHPNVSFSPYGIYSIYQDRQGIIWFGTASLGLCRYDGDSLSWHYEKQLQTTPGGGDFGTRSVFEDMEGFYWINNSRFRYQMLESKDRQLVYKKEEGIGFLNENNQIEYPFFLSIEQDDQGDIWMVTYDNGIWRNNGKKLIHYPIKEGDEDVLLFTIYKDKKGVLWVGTHQHGVYKYNGKKFIKFES